MKRLLNRTLALLLTLCLLLAFAPAVAAEEAAPQRAHPTIQLMTEPKYAVGFNEFYGKYVKFNDYNTNTSGICDCFGNVTMTGKNVDLEPLENGMAKEMGRNEQGCLGWAILSPTGKRLTPYTSGGEIGCAKDWYTGKYYNWAVGDFRDEGQHRVDFNGNDPFAGKYDRMTDIWNGQFGYCKDGKWGIDDLSGRHILPCQYDYLNMVGKDIGLFEKNGKFGVLRTDGTVLIPAKYDEIQTAPDGSGYVVTENGKQGRYGADFRQTIPCDYQELRCLSDTLAYARIEQGGSSELRLMRTDGTLLRTFAGGYIETLYADDTHSLFGYFGHYVDGITPMALFDAQGQVLLETKGIDMTATKALVMVFTAQGAEVYDHNAQLLNELEGAATTYGDLPLVYRDKHYAIVGSDGKLLTDYIFEDREDTFHDGTLCLKQDGKWNFFAEDGTPLLDFRLDVAPRFFESDYAGYMVNGYSGILRIVGVDDSLFADVANDAWYREAADYCAENGLMVGTAPGVFSPNVTTTRSMIVSLLYRLSGASSPTGESPFADVPDGQWYTDAVIWAAENGVVAGYGNGKFGPNDAITREQIAVIFYNYAKLAGLDVSQAKALDDFPDANKVGSWSRTAVSWAVAAELISGSVINGQTCLDPQGKATRAMTASIMMRFALMNE